MRFKEGAFVYTADNREVGTIERVVLDPESNEVTHVVVRKGWLFSEDKVVPIQLIDQATEDRVVLSPDTRDFDDLPNFEERHYVPPDESIAPASPGYVRPTYWYPPVGATWPTYYTGTYGYPAAPYVAYTEQNIPDGTVALKEGARVVSDDDRDVGTVDEVIADSDSGTATHLVIEEGWLFTEKRAIPTDWVRSVMEDEIRLSVPARVLERVPEFQR